MTNLDQSDYPSAFMLFISVVVGVVINALVGLQLD
jgi:hypothetical protein